MKPYAVLISGEVFRVPYKHTILGAAIDPGLAWSLYHILKEETRSFHSFNPIDQSDNIGSLSNITAPIAPDVFSTSSP